MNDSTIVSVTAIRVIYVIAELFYYEPINEFDKHYGLQKFLKQLW